MEQIYHIHPVFEFFLTAYLGFLVAPKFLSEFLLDKISNEETTKNKEVIMIKLIEINKEIDKIKSAFFDLPFSTHDAGRPVSKFIKENFDTLKFKIDTKAREVSESNDESIRKKFIDIFKYRYHPSFIFSAAYCLLLLLINGCGWVHTFEHDVSMIIYLGYFNLFSFASISVLLSRNIIFMLPYFNNKENKRIVRIKSLNCDLHFIIKMIIIFIIISFGILPLLFKYPPAIFNINYAYSLTFTMTFLIIISGAPLLLYAIGLNSGVRECYSVVYESELRNYEFEFNSHLNEYKLLFDKWEYNYNEMFP